MEGLESRVLIKLYVSLDAKSKLQVFRLVSETSHESSLGSVWVLCCRELEAMFEVTATPTVVVLRPDGSVLSSNAVEEIQTLGPSCYQNWKEAAELVERNFLMNEEYDQSQSRTLTDILRRHKYKVEDQKKNRRKREEEDEEEEGGGGAW